MKKFLISVVIFVSIVALGFYFFRTTEVVIPIFNDISNYIGATSTEKIIKKVEEKITELPPILSIGDYSNNSNLSIAGIFDETNRQRKENGSLPPLSQNAKLNQIASIRVKDMFEKGYFEHKSPTGIGASDIAYDVGYEFILIGENIAIGNFESDKVLVQAWMDSPGHRANILNKHYTEIGIAAERGLYKDKKVWLAVQIFGRPLRLCNEPDYSINKSIDEGENKIDLLNIKAQAYYFEIKSMEKEKTENINDYNKKIGEYNEIVRQIKLLNDEIKSFIDKYNSQVKVFNACIEG